MKVPFIDFGKEFRKYEDEIMTAMMGVINEGQLILRDEVEKFEKELAKYVGTKYAVGLNSGTDALYLALWAEGIGKGDEVLVPSHTFVATAQVVNQLGATPVLYDLDGVLEFTEKTRAIIPAHISGGFGANMELVMQEAEKRNLFVIEDACQALGAMQFGRMAGSIGHCGAFSFYPAKILGCLGDGGALVTNDKDLYEQVKNLRNHCKDTELKDWGINSRLDNVQAAVLRVRLKHIKEILGRRDDVATMYFDGLEGVVGLPKNPPDRVWQDFIIETERRDELFDFLKKNGVETMKNEYPMPIGKLPRAEHYERTSLRIPCNDILTDEEVYYVITKIKEFFKK